ncbi:MerR family transcriptional regulator [Roseateles sp. 22389]|uniref:MerR family transcriptional regulator n=1 Tax=Roseateles sp. 22389 TaxID=3453916 RepID=UPI003F848B54
MRIGELAKQLGIKPSAIRFYEASGLLPEGERGLNGYREYGPETLQRLQFIQLSQRLGFSLDGIRQALAQEVDGRLPHELVQASLKRRREEIARMRAELDAQDAELERLGRTCEENWAQGQCFDREGFLASMGEALEAAAVTPPASPAPARARSRRMR